MKIRVYGAGYVGLVTATCLADIGHEVYCIDINKEKIRLLNEGQLPFYEPGLTELILRNKAQSRLFFLSDIANKNTTIDAHIIAVNTPSAADGSIDLTYVDSVLDAIKQNYQQGTIIIKSTVVPGTANLVQQKMPNFNVISNPEFLREGRAVADFMQPERIVIGAESDAAIEVANRLYQYFIDRQRLVLVMSRNSAELSKYAANAFLATKISFMNEIAYLADHVDADIDSIKSVLASDARISPLFLNAGCGFGGSCFPKDIDALVKLAERKSLTTPLLKSVKSVNERQQRILFDKLHRKFKGDLNNKTVAIWGLSFKPETDDIRSASSLVLIDLLLAAGVSVKAHDPLATKKVKLLYQNRSISFFDEAIEAVHSADALLVVTEWPQYNATPVEAILHSLKDPNVFDGRNCLDKKRFLEMGAYYEGVGK